MIAEIQECKIDRGIPLIVFDWNLQPGRIVGTFVVNAIVRFSVDLYGRN